jgi:hypothetical protein
MKDKVACFIFENMPDAELAVFLGIEPEELSEIDGDSLFERIEDKVDSMVEAKLLEWEGVRLKVS